MASLGLGVVKTFDDRGHGTILDDGGAEWFFHCTSISGGGREINVGERVAFELVPGRQGSYEATSVTRTSQRALLGL